MSFFETLQQETAREREYLLSSSFIQLGHQGQLGVDSYRAFLGQAYHHVRHTVPLLMSCGARLPSELEWLRAAIAEYIEEEYGHEQWILNDITACGGDAEQVRTSTPLPETELLVSYVYDFIQRRNPIGFFGMVNVLEGTSVAMATEAANATQARLQLPDAAFTYLRSHGSLDIEHMQLFRSLMDQVTQPEDQQAIIHVSRMVYRLYADMFRALPLN